MYKQVKLTKNNVFVTVWIPEHFAHVGKYLKIKDEDGWQVLEVYQARISQEQLSEYERDYLHQRKMSDI